MNILITRSASDGADFPTMPERCRG